MAIIYMFRFFNYNILYIRLTTVHLLFFCEFIDMTKNDLVILLSNYIYK
jgi:hypothetical protein